MKPLPFLVGFAAALSGCVFRHEVTDLDPQSGQPPLVVEKKIPGKVAVAIVGNLRQPLVIQSTKVSGRMIGGDQEVTIHLGEPLKKAVTAALTEATAEPTFVEREDQAIALARQGSSAIVVRYNGASGSGDMRQSGFSWESSMTVTLAGEVRLIAPGAKEERRSFSTYGADRRTTFSMSWADHAVPAPKAATEQAISKFALRVVAEATAALAK